MIDLASPAFWAPVLTSTALVSTIGLAVSIPYRGWIEKRLQHGFDKKLEQLRSDFRREEDQLRAALRSQDERLNVVRGNALSGFASRQLLLDRKRIDALEEIWALCVSMHKLKSVARAMESINAEELLKHSATGNPDAEKVRQFAKVILTMSGVDPEAKQEPPSNTAQKMRPFAPPQVWTLFSTYQQVAWHPTMQLIVAYTGVGPQLIKDTAPLVLLVKAALPHQTRFLDEYGVAGLVYLVAELEEKVLSEIIKSLGDAAFDREAVAAAAAISQAAQTALEVPSAPIPDIPNVRSRVPPPGVANVRP